MVKLCQLSTVGRAPCLVLRVVSPEIQKAVLTAVISSLMRVLADSFEASILELGEFT